MTWVPGLKKEEDRRRIIIEERRGPKKEEELGYWAQVQRDRRYDPNPRVAWYGFNGCVVYVNGMCTVFFFENFEVN